MLLLDLMLLVILWLLLLGIQHMWMLLLNTPRLATSLPMVWRLHCDTCWRISCSEKIVVLSRMVLGLHMLIISRRLLHITIRIHRHEIVISIVSTWHVLLLIGLMLGWIRKESGFGLIVLFLDLLPISRTVIELSAQPSLTHLLIVLLLLLLVMVLHLQLIIGCIRVDGRWRRRCATCPCRCSRLLFIKLPLIR